jgi:hypothetical protein
MQEAIPITRLCPTAEQLLSAAEVETNLHGFVINHVR